MKKYLAFLLAAALLLSLAACGGDQTAEAGGQENDPAPPQTETIQPDPAPPQTETTQPDPAPGEGGEGSQDVDFSRTEGTWRLDGEEGAASIYMDGEGGFVAYYASGYVEAAGYLEYVDEYGDGNGRYDMYDGDLGWINGFYFDSDTQIHMGNDGTSIYILEGFEPTETGSGAAVLIYSPGFTGTTPVKTDNDFHGGHYYEDKLSDTTAVIVNASFENDFMSAGEESLEEYTVRCAELVCEDEIRELTMQDSALGSYPASRVTWLTGWNEDTRHWDALIVFTDTYTCFYGFNTWVDEAEDLADLREDVFAQLTLEFPGE